MPQGLQPSAATNQRNVCANGRNASTSTCGSMFTVVSRDDACRQDVGAVKHANIIDIDTSNSTNPIDALVFAKPSVDELLQKGPQQIMNNISGQHRTDVRWVHLRSNCMSWIQDLMDKICEERGLALNTDHGADGGFENPILRKDLWSNLFNGAQSDRVGARFMNPTYTPFSLDLQDEESDTHGSTIGNRDHFVLYLPYLHWDSVESWKKRKALVDAVTNRQTVEEQADADLFRTYLNNRQGPIHNRRSLDQAYYHNFGMTRSFQDFQQVIERYTSRVLKQEAKLIVVDQLWLWVIRGTHLTRDEHEHVIPDMVITAFADRLNGEEDSANVFHGIVDHLARRTRISLRTANDLVALIIEHCTGVFFQRQLTQDKWFLEFFAAAIGLVRDKQKKAFTEFCRSTRELQELESRRALTSQRSAELIDISFSMNIETELFGQIKNMIEELDSIDYVVQRSENVVKSLTRVQKTGSLRAVAELLSERRSSWAALAQAANTVRNEIQGQMDLKQRQAGLSEVRTSQHHAEVVVRQGRAMLLFTIVTVIFLPMTFIATWLGMNTSDNSTPLTFWAASSVMFPTTIVVSAMLMWIVFNEGVILSVRNVYEKLEDLASRLVVRRGNQNDQTRRTRRRGRGRRHELDDVLRLGGWRSNSDDDGGETDLENGI